MVGKERRQKKVYEMGTLIFHLPFRGEADLAANVVHRTEEAIPAQLLELR